VVFPPERPASTPAAVRTFFAVALQLARAFSSLVDVIAGVYEGNLPRVRRAAEALAHAILDGARDRATEPFPRSRIDQQGRTDSLHRTRARRPGRTSQAVAATRRQAKATR
jgi:hypothetical protein